MVTAIDCQEMLERLSARAEIEKGSAVKEDDGPSKLEVDEELNMNDVEKKEVKESIEMASDG